MDDKQPDHCNGSPSSSGLRSPLEFILGDDDGDDDVASSHWVDESVLFILSERRGERHCW